MRESKSIEGKKTQNNQTELHDPCKITNLLKKRPGGATGPDSENLEHTSVGCLSDEGVMLRNQID